MPINLVIQEKRKELGLTQEQVAKHLNVSIPAVSKWESGSSNPDISLLAPLARLLKVDLNTLLCFQEDISNQEIECFCREVASVVQSKGIADGFEAAEQKIREYPHNETLLHCLAVQLDSLLAMSELSADEMRRYDDLIVKWYSSLAGSSHSSIRNSAEYMLVNKWIRKGDYEKAQEILNQMPDREDYVSSMADKRMLQINMDLRQGRPEEAMKGLQNALLMAVNKVQMLLYKMIDAELAAGSIHNAEKIADKAGQMASFFDLSEYGSYVAPLHIAVTKKDVGECIRLLRKLLASMITPWEMSSSLLYDRIAKNSDMKQMLPAVLTELEKESAYDFLHNFDEFKELIAEYRSMTE